MKIIYSINEKTWNIAHTVCLKINATHYYDNDLLRAVTRNTSSKNASLERERERERERDIESMFVLLVIISASRTCNLFFSFLSQKKIFIILMDSINFETVLNAFCFQMNIDAKYFPLLSKALWSKCDSSYRILFSNVKLKRTQYF